MFSFSGAALSGGLYPIISDTITPASIGNNTTPNSPGYISLGTAFSTFAVWVDSGTTLGIIIKRSTGVVSANYSFAFSPGTTYSLSLFVSNAAPLSVAINGVVLSGGSVSDIYATNQIATCSQGFCSSRFISIGSSPYNFFLFSC